MDEFKNFCVEFWLDTDGLIKSSVDAIQTVRYAASSLLVAGVFAFTVGQYISPINSAEVARALSTVPVSEELAKENNTNIVISNLLDINTRIDSKLMKYLTDEQFSQELTDLAEKAILKLNRIDTKSIKNAFA